MPQHMKVLADTLFDSLADTFKYQMGLQAGHYFLPRSHVQTPVGIIAADPINTYNLEEVHYRGPGLICVHLSQMEAFPIS